MVVVVVELWWWVQMWTNFVTHDSPRNIVVVHYLVRVNDWQSKKNRHDYSNRRCRHCRRPGPLEPRLSSGSDDDAAAARRCCCCCCDS